MVDANVQSSSNVLMVDVELIEEELDGKSLVVLSPYKSSEIEHFDEGW